jgi:hypothetical protein
LELSGFSPGRDRQIKPLEVWMSMLPISSKSSAACGREISRLLTAAIVNQSFCHLLLTNPASALAKGYNGEAFRLEREERDRVLSIQARSLADFALQLTSSPNSKPVKAGGQLFLRENSYKV